MSPAHLLNFTGQLIFLLSILALIITLVTYDTKRSVDSPQFERKLALFFLTGWFGILLFASSIIDIFF